jgi:hypothetical protein
MKKPKVKPYVPGLVRGQLPRSPLREATQVIISSEPSQPTRAILDYPNREESPNEKSRRQLAKSMPKVRLNRAIVPFNLKLGDYIL